MAQLPDVFQPDQESTTDFGVLPDDWYEAEIVKSLIKSTNAGDGKYISLTFRITDGENEGRFLFKNLNIVNKSDMAVKIAKSDLKKICNACGIDELEDTDDLHNIPMMVKTIIKPETAQWPAKNEIKDFKAV